MDWNPFATEEDDSTAEYTHVTVDVSETIEQQLSEVAVQFCSGRQTTIPYTRETTDQQSLILHHPQNGTRRVVYRNIEELQYNKDIETVEVANEYQVDYRLQDVPYVEFGRITDLHKENAMNYLIKWVESNTNIRGFGRRVSDEMFEYVTPYGDVRYVMGEDELVFTNDELELEIVW